MDLPEPMSPRVLLRSSALALLAMGSVVAMGCAPFSPRPVEEVPFLERAQTQERAGLRVTVAVLARDEARRYLAEDFATAQSVERLGYVRGAGAASPEAPPGTS
jgi:hypothetical protein